MAQPQDIDVDIPGVGVITFPASMSEQDINLAAQKLYKEAKRPALSALAPTHPTTSLDRLIDLLPTAGGIGGGIAGGIGGTAFGLGIGGVPGAIGGATLGGGFGESLRQLINRFRGEGAPMTPLEAATNISREGAIQGGSEAIGAGVAAGATRGAHAVYRGYLKPSLAAKNISKANDVVETALNEALPITTGGVARGEGRISELRQQVDALLAQSPERIDLKRMADRIRAFARQRYYRPGADPADYQAALSVADRLDAHPALKLPPKARVTRPDVPLQIENQMGGPAGQIAQLNAWLRDWKTSALARQRHYRPGADPADYQAALSVADRLDAHPALKLPPKARVTRLDVPVSEANQAKRALQESASSTYGAPNANATKRATKEGARTLRLQIENQMGGPAGQIAQLNARESKLIDAARAIKQAVEREASQNPIYGVKSMVSGGVGYGVGGPTGAVIGFGTRQALRPGSMTTAAILAHRFARTLGVSMATAARLTNYLLAENDAQEPSAREP